MTKEEKVKYYVALAKKYGAETVIRFLVDVIAELRAGKGVTP